MLKNYGHFLCLHIATRYKEKYKEIWRLLLGNIRVFFKKIQNIILMEEAAKRFGGNDFWEKLYFKQRLGRNYILQVSHYLIPFTTGSQHPLPLSLSLG
jgi:REP element-mobilizing transposase RayT